MVFEKSDAVGWYLKAELLASGSTAQGDIFNVWVKMRYEGSGVYSCTWRHCCVFV